MGLDLVVEGCAKAGCEAEWRSLLERCFADDGLSEADDVRLQEISIPGYQRIGAPRVGFDPVADKWIIEARQAKSADEIAAILKEFHGYYALPLIKCDGVPFYSNAGAYDGVDETSFRGAFLNGCQDVLGKQLLGEAWNSKFPEAAVLYGQALLAAANAAEGPGRLQPKGRSFLSRLGLAKTPERLPVTEQIEIVRAAGRWFIFWGERGHPIRAWF